ncbi:zinc-ribbon containing domain [Caudoviricetes sp.]|nr:zinc-ribbon containing domain [Caudoviricetes sp.]
MSKSNLSPFIGQWRCPSCGRTFGRQFKLCAYCPTGDPIEDDWRGVVHEQLIVENKAPWAVVEQAVAQPPGESVGQLKKERKWRRTIVRRADHARL